MVCSVQGGTDFCTARDWKTAEMSRKGRRGRQCWERRRGFGNDLWGLRGGGWAGKRFSELEGNLTPLRFGERRDLVLKVFLA